MPDLFPVYEVGSMPKLNARVKALRIKGESFASDEDLLQLERFGARAQIETSPVVELLRKQREEGRKLTVEEKEVVIDCNALMNLKLQEGAGLHFVYDGEARRSEMYRHCARQIDGFEDYPEMLRSRGPDSWRASICQDVPTLKTPSGKLPEVKELEFVKKFATAAIKVPLDDPYMIANMTGNRYYTQKFREMYDQDPQKLRYAAKRELTLDIARNVIKPQVEALVASGATWIQLDIPSATIDLQHLPIMVEGINAVTEGLDSTKFSLHICYPKRVSLSDKSGYDLLFPHILDLAPNVNHLSLELANGDQYIKDLACFGKYAAERKFELGIGVVDITLEKQQKGEIETPQQVRDRIVTSAAVLQDPALIYVAPDCGARQLTLDRTVQLFEIIVEGAALARKG